jgi:hypothetical protein
MPIKFRCQHCEQFLGIARSRAGAIVDCPQCGRSLRVPNLDGRVRKMPPPTKNVRGDSGLMSALSELATLEDTDAPASASAAHDISPVRTTPERINVGTIPLERVEDILPPDDFDEDSDAGPFALSESLSELASLSNPANDGPAEEQLLLEMRQISHPSASPLLMTFGGLLLLLCGTAGGWWLGRSAQPVQPSSASSGDTAAGAVVAKDDVPEAQPGVIRQTGSVNYRDTAGAPQPDAGALVLLLPAEHEGSFRLHAKAFTKPAGHPDRVATLAAMSAVGGAATVADQTGSYYLDSTSLENKIIVVVSIHQTRPADVPIPEEIAAVLNRWFDSTSHICGQLAIQMSKAKSPSVPVDFTF